MIHSALMQAFRGKWQEAVNILDTRPELVNEQPMSSIGGSGSIGAPEVPAVRSHTCMHMCRFTHTGLVLMQRQISYIQI